LPLLEPITPQKVAGWLNHFVCECGYNDKEVWHKEVKQAKADMKEIGSSPYRDKVMALVKSGMPKKNIAAELHIRPETVSRILKKKN